MSQRISLDRLRSVSIPPVAIDEPDHVTSLRKTLTHHAETPGRVLLCVPDEIAAMVPTGSELVESQADKPSETKATKSSKLKS